MKIKLFENWLSTEEELNREWVLKKLRDEKYDDIVKAVIGEGDPEKCYIRCRELLSKAAWKTNDKETDIIYNTVFGKVINVMYDEWEAMDIASKYQYTHRPLDPSKLSHLPVLQAFVKAVNEEKALDSLVNKESDIRVVNYWFVDSLGEIERAMEMSPSFIDQRLQKVPTDYCLLLVDLVSEVEWSPDDERGGRWRQGTSTKLKKWLDTIGSRFFLVAIDMYQQRLVYNPSISTRQLNSIVPGITDTLEHIYTKSFTQGTGRVPAKRIARSYGL